METQMTAPFIPTDATITVSQGGGSVSVHTDDLILDSSSKREDPDQVGTAFNFVSRELSLDGAPIVQITVIQGFDGSSRFVDGDIHSSVNVSSEDLSPGNYQVEVTPE